MEEGFRILHICPNGNKVVNTTPQNGLLEIRHDFFKITLRKRQNSVPCKEGTKITKCSYK